VVLSGDHEYAWFSGFLPPRRILLSAGIVAFAAQFAYAWQGPLLNAANRIARVVAGQNDSRTLDNEMVFGVMAVCAILVLVVARGGRLRGKLAAFASELIVLTLVGYIFYHVRQLTADYRLNVRNFYGALRVRDNGRSSDFDATRTLTHGTINHGEQFLNPARRNLATTYYGPSTRVGMAIRGQAKSP